MLYHYLPAIAHVLIIIWIILSMQCPFIHPYAYSILILLFTIITADVFILLLLLLFCYCYCYKTVTTDKLLRASLFPGADELTTHLLRLINILWLPLCRINKFGFTSLEDYCDPLYLWVIIVPTKLSLHEDVPVASTLFHSCTILDCYDVQYLEY
jgi:hypothetical protein